MSSSRSPYSEVKLAAHSHSHEGSSQYLNSGIRLTKRVPSVVLSHGPNPSAPTRALQGWFTIYGSFSLSLPFRGEET